MDPMGCSIIESWDVIILVIVVMEMAMTQIWQIKRDDEHDDNDDNDDKDDDDDDDNDDDNHDFLNNDLPTKTFKKNNMLNGQGSSSQLGGLSLWRDSQMTFPAEHDGTTSFILSQQKGGALLQSSGGFGQEDVRISPEICDFAERRLDIIPIHGTNGIFTYICHKNQLNQTIITHQPKSYP